MTRWERRNSQRRLDCNRQATWGAHFEIIVRSFASYGARSLQRWLAPSAYPQQTERDTTTRLWVYDTSHATPCITCLNVASPDATRHRIRERKSIETAVHTRVPAGATQSSALCRHCDWLKHGPVQRVRFVPLDRSSSKDVAWAWSREYERTMIGTLTWQISLSWNHASLSKPS